MSEFRDRGPWKIRSRQSVFENPWIRVFHHEVTNPSGGDGQYGVVEFENLAIGVLPVDRDGMVRLVGQHRFPRDYYSWELPEGGGKPDVPPVDSAKRELLEETGLTAEHWQEFFRADLSNAVTDEIAIGFLAWELNQGEAEPEEEEEITLRSVHFDEAVRMACDGEIRDIFSQGMLLKAEKMRRQGRLPSALQDILR